MVPSDKTVETTKQLLFVDDESGDTIAHFGDAGDLDAPDAGDRIMLSSEDFDGEGDETAAIETVIETKMSYRVTDTDTDYSQVTVETDDGASTVYQIQTDIVSVEEESE